HSSPLRLTLLAYTTLFRSSTTTNGPVPIGSAQFSSIPRSIPAGDWIAVHCWLSDSSREESGSERRKRTWVSSSGSTSSRPTYVSDRKSTRLNSSHASSSYA